jgi:hypothetical protein
MNIKEKIMKNKRKYQFLFFIIFLFAYLNDLYAANEYIDKWPVINDDHVNIRDYPDINKGTAQFQLNKNQKIVIRYKTINEKKINDSVNYWYYVSVFDGEYQNRIGWVYGKYISFTDNYNEEYWNTTIFGIKSIDEMVAYKNIVANKIITRLFGKYNDDGYDTNLLNQYALIHQQVSNRWYMRESNFSNLNTYSTDYGNIMGFINKTRGKWFFYRLEIEKKIEGMEIFPGMTINEIEKIFGNEYTTNNNILKYNFNEDFDSWFWTFNLNNGKIISFSITEYYD